MNQQIKTVLGLSIIVILAITIGIFTGIIINQKSTSVPKVSQPPINPIDPINPVEENPVACTMEAMLCSDGKTYVSRTGPNCEFAPCPEEKNIEKQIGYIKKIYEKGGKRHLDIDYVQFLDGDEAIKAIKEDGKCPADVYPDPSMCTPNNFYIRNENPLMRTFEVNANATVKTNYDITNDGKINYESGIIPEGKSTTIVLLEKVFNDQNNIIEGHKLIELFNIDIDVFGKIVNLEQQYIP